MRKASVIACVAVLAAGAAVASAQGLADVAKAEEARRKSVKAPVKVYTNESLRGPDGGEAPPPPSTPAPAVTGDSQGAAKPALGAAGDKPPAPADAPGTRDEKYWRERIGSARADLHRNQAFLEALKSQVQGLYTEFVATDDPAQRAVVEKKRLAAIAEQDRVQADIEKQTKAIAAIEDEARRGGVPAGWLR